MKTNHLPVSGSVLRTVAGLGLISLAGFAGHSASASPMLAEVSLNIGINAEAPPPPPTEIQVAAPGPGYVWLGGYYDGSPGHYRWVRGHWDRPPHGREHARYYAPRWDRGHDGHYHRVEGGWR